MNITAALLHLFPASRPLVDYEVRDNSDGQGQFIARWALDAPQPTPAQLAAAWGAIQSHEAWQPARDQRAPLLDDADKRINTLEDQGIDATAERRYRQALRDLTKGTDPTHPNWPTRPW